jgi:hypothetical protein
MMKKTVKVNEEKVKVTFKCWVDLDQKLREEKYRRGGYDGRKTTHRFYFWINDVKYEGERTFSVSGGPYTEKFIYEGKDYSSHTKLIEGILNNKTIK